MQEKTMNTFLHGGPSIRIPDHVRICYVSDREDSLKLKLGTTCEHFVRTLERIQHNGRELQVFSWTHSTFVAE
jgi:hypothetical protein